MAIQPTKLDTRTSVPEHEPKPVVPDHEMLKVIGSGAFGDVWLARNIMGRYRAVKVCYRQRFEKFAPFEREFEGVRKCEPVSRAHEGLTDILHVGKNDAAGYFYCIMELADDRATGTTVEPAQYQARTLHAELEQHGRLPATECVRIGLTLTGALAYLHQRSLIHRDIKPANIIFVEGVPKLADIGLVTDVGSRMFVGTEGFIPPEGPGQPSADCFGLGKVFYEMFTGRDRLDFPAELEQTSERFGEVIRKACAPNLADRYPSASEMHADVARLISGKAETVAIPAALHNLPAALTSFVGRQNELAEVKQLLKTNRLLTLTGLGGSGKTRLALEVAGNLPGEFANGVWLVELAALTDPNLVPATVGQVLGVREEPSRPLLATLGEFLRDRQVLLVLDNCEHLTEASARLAATMLQAAPQLKILATSQCPLGVPGEVIWNLPPLSTPQTGMTADPDVLERYEAVQLFVARATAIKPDFVLEGATALAVAKICHGLDGIPLAIELAAARVRAMTVMQIAERLNDRFRLLTKGTQTGEARHRTLRAVIDWSYELMPEAERPVFCRLGVFAGGFDLAAAEAMADDALDLVARLVDRSLVVADEDSTGQLRYRLLETVRQYALEKLAPSGDAQRRHAAYFLKLAEEADPELTGDHQEQWLKRLETEHDNFRAAFAAADTETGLRIAVALWWFWHVRGHYAEGRSWIEAALQRAPEAPAALRSEALNGAGALASDQADYATARSHFEQSLALRRASGNRQGVAASLNNLGLIAHEQSDFATARALFEEGLAIFRELGHSQYAIAALLNNLGLVAREQGEYERARSLFDESLALRRQLSDQQGIALSLHNLGITASEQGDYDRARSLLEQGLTIQRSLDDKRDLAWSLCNLGDVLWAEGAPEAAEELYRQAQEQFRALGDQRGIAYAQLGLGHAAACRSDAGTAETNCRASLAIFREIHDKAGAASALERLGRIGRRQAECEESLAIRRQLGNPRCIASALEAFACLPEYEPSRVVGLMAAADRLRQQAGSPLPVCERPVHDAALAAARERLGEEAYAAAWERGYTAALDEIIT